MSDANQIDSVIAALRFAWQRHPELRLTQVIATAASLGGWSQPDPFHCEDEVMKRGLEALGGEPRPVYTCPDCRAVDDVCNEEDGCFFVGMGS